MTRDDGSRNDGDRPERDRLLRRLLESQAIYDELVGRVSDVVERPTARQLPDGPLHYVWSLWRSLGNSEPPTWTAFEPQALLPRLHEVMLVEVLDRGRDVRYRLHGSRASDTHGHDLTGQTLAESAYGDEIKNFFITVYALAAFEQMPLFLRHGAPENIPATGFDRLVLPLTPRQPQVPELLVMAQAWQVRPDYAWRGLSLVRSLKDRER